MSRVFEALKKAGEEKRQQPETLVEEVRDLIHETATIGSNQVNRKWQLGENGKAHNALRAFPSLTPTAKSWRERMEELFFGWDLGRYSNYPIVALETDSAASEQYK